MRSLLIGLVLIFNFLRCFPHLVIFFIHKNRKLVKADVLRWLEKKKLNYGLTIGFIYVLSFFPEFRNLFYIRVGFFSHFLNLFCHKLSTLYILTNNIGEGFYISHGFTSGIGAKSIGKNCCIYQHVNIGNQNGFPTILDNVTIYPGAVIMGNITIGNNVTVGANANVFTDVPDNCTVYPASSKIMKWSEK